MKILESMQPLSSSLLDEILNYLTKNFSFNQSLKRLIINGIDLGRLNIKFENLLMDSLGHLTSRQGNDVLLNQSGWQEIALLLESLCRLWCLDGYYSGWRNEQCDVIDPFFDVLFPLERSSFRPLGLKSQAVHLDVWTQIEDSILIWVAKRSAYKLVHPNKLDNIVGGGVSAGESAKEAIIREGFEEANISADLFAIYSYEGMYYTERIVDRGVMREYLHCFQCKVNEDFKPQNRDGKVESFSLKSPETITQSIINDEIMLDSVISFLHLFNRLGLIETDHALQSWLKTYRFLI